MFCLHSLFPECFSAVCFRFDFVKFSFDSSNGAISLQTVISPPILKILLEYFTRFSICKDSDLTRCIIHGRYPNLIYLM